MTEKDFFNYKLFLLLNISDLSFFLLQNCNPPLQKKVTPFFQQTPLRVEVLSSLSLFGNLVGGSTAQQKWGKHYVNSDLILQTSPSLGVRLFYEMGR